MFAKSEITKNIGSRNVPLQTQQNPPLVALKGVASETLMQFQVVTLNSTTLEVLPVDYNSLPSSPSWANLRLGVVATPAAGNGEQVQVYVQGFFNVSAVYLLNYYGTIPNLAKALNALNQPTMFFEDIDSDAVLNV